MSATKNMRTLLVLLVLFAACSSHTKAAENLTGYIDKTGKMVIKPQFLGAREFSEGLAAVLVPSSTPGNPQWGYIDKTGKFIIQAQFVYAQKFSEGLASVQISYGDGFGFIDKTGKFIIPPTLKSAGSFSEGMALFISMVRTPILIRRAKSCLPFSRNPFRECFQRVLRNFSRVVNTVT